MACAMGFLERWQRVRVPKGLLTNRHLSFGMLYRPSRQMLAWKVWTFAFALMERNYLYVAEGYIFQGVDKDQLFLFQAGYDHKGDEIARNATQE